MSIVLEIGAGHRPAIYEPGSVLLEPGTAYHAVDAWRDSTDDPYRPEEQRNAYLKSLTINNGAELPFANQTVGHVIMKSVFGEYTMPPEFTGSCLENTESTLYEAFRVLEDGGHIAIAEENTPEPPATVDRISFTLLDAGFEDITVFPCQEMENPHWWSERLKYWHMQEDDVFKGPGHYNDVAYLVKARRPAVASTTFKRYISLPDVWRANQARGWTHPDNEEWVKEITLTKSVKSPDWSEYADEPLHAHLKPVRIVAKDGVMDLKTYYEQFDAGEIEPLFVR